MWTRSCTKWFLWLWPGGDGHTFWTLQKLKCWLFVSKTVWRWIKPKTQVGQKMQKVCNYLYACFVWWFCQYLYKRSSLLSQVSARWGAAVFGHSLPVKSKERLSCEIVDTFFIQHMPALTYASIVYVTDADENCSTSVCVFTAIRRCFFINGTRKSAVCKFFIPFLSIVPVRFLQFDSFLTAVFQASVLAWLWFTEC